MSQDLDKLVSEVKRLISLTETLRENEGVYANVSQLQFLLKKVSSSNGQLSDLNGVEKFISDLASSDSEILKLLDEWRVSQND